MFTSTVEILPEGKKLKELFNMIEKTYIIKISKKGFFEKTPDYQVENNTEAFQNFINLAPNIANAIIGIRTATTTVQFNDGTFLYTTYSGSPARIE
jgi:regulator of nucleoside diphosphate kinase